MFSIFESKLIMSDQLKLKLKSGLFMGTSFAVLMALFNYALGEEFSWILFILHFTFFGFGMSILAKSPKKQN